MGDCVCGARGQEQATPVTPPVTESEMMQVNKSNKSQSLMSPITAEHRDYNLSLSIQNGLRESLSATPSPAAANGDACTAENDTIALQTSQCAQRTKHELKSDGVHSVRSLSFTEYAPNIFSTLRQHFGINHDSEFLSVLTGDNNALLSFLTNSKGGQFFFFSGNTQFIIKTMSKSELQFLLDILPFYNQYMLQETQSLIARFYGVYTLHQFRISNHKTLDISFFISNNVFYSSEPRIEIERRYDLKGSTQGRRTEHAKAIDGHILKDVNFIEDGVRLRISKHRSCRGKLLHDQIEKDSKWLEQHLIMDYSMLIGIAHNTKHKVYDDTNVNTKSVFYEYHNGMLSDDATEIYFVGIIDMLQKYNKKKKAAHLVKGIKYETEKLSTVPPNVYAERFRQFFKDCVV
mmetsp:Transcript_31566/g.51100  ORF Transcript_31566/g.51100 Transcript_31566/m.51100 type:complete len:404 (+) Transcript_31566:31-1242(+)